MLNKNFKELTPVVYGEDAVKILPPWDVKPGLRCMAPHWHERMEILRVECGELKLTVGEEQYSVYENETVIIHPCQLHEGMSSCGVLRYTAVMFDIRNFYNGTAASEKYLKPIFQNKVTFCSKTDNPALLKAVDELIGCNGNPLYRVGKVYETVALLYSSCVQNVAVGSEADKRFYAVADYIAEHFTQKISARDLCREFGYAEPYLCRRFKEVTGHTVGGYIKLLRLQKAEELLTGSEYSVSRICEECGFYDLPYFTKTFSGHFGMPPNEYRTEHRTVKT